MNTINIKERTRKSVTFESGGHQLFGMLHTPQTEKKVAAVVIIHGLASHKIGTNRAWVQLAEGLRQAGVAALRFDQRGFGDSEGDSSQITLSDLVDDVVHAISYMQQVEGIDPKRIALFGSSLGGTLAILAAARTRVPLALALWAPVATGMLSITDLFHANPKLALLPDPAKAFSTYRGIPLSSRFQEEFKHLSAIEVLKQLSDVPLLHMHGAADTLVSLDHQKAFQKVRGEACAESHFITYPDAQHSLGNEPICKVALEKYIAWLTTQLQ